MPDWTERLTEEERVLKETVEAATKGRWFWNSYDAVYAGSGDASEVITVVHHLNDIYKGDEIYGQRRAEAQANATFIAASREAVPALLRTVSALRALVEELREAGFPIARGFPNFCHVDRRGVCQSHGKAKPCPVSLFRAALALTEDEMRKRLEVEK